MARKFMYVHEQIYKEANHMQREFAKVPVNGRQTFRADQNWKGEHYGY